MKPANNKIIVRVDNNQKQSFMIGGVEVQSASKYETNYREKSPVIAEVVDGNEQVFKGDILLCHHNLFYLPSPYHLGDGLFAIPYSNVLFAKIQAGGSLLPICGNLLCERVDIETDFELPVEDRQQCINKVIVTDGGYTPYKKGQLLFTRPYSYYEIVYIYNGKEIRVFRCSQDNVCGFLQKNIPL
jgi:hypothetical protein